MGSIPEREPEKWLPHPRMAAGAQITQSRYEEVVTKNNDVRPLWCHNRNEANLNHFMSNNWRASLVPAAAVIPAPIAYTKVVAVKKLVVDSRTRAAGPASGRHWLDRVLPLGEGRCSLLSAGHQNQEDYFEKSRVFKAGNCLNTLAWNNKIDLGSILLV
jgi:hypothetical protein